MPLEPWLYHILPLRNEPDQHVTACSSRYLIIFSPCDGQPAWQRDHIRLPEIIPILRVEVEKCAKKESESREKRNLARPGLAMTSTHISDVGQWSQSTPVTRRCDPASPEELFLSCVSFFLSSPSKYEVSPFVGSCSLSRASLRLLDKSLSSELTDYITSTATIPQNPLTILFTSEITDPFRPALNLPHFRHLNVLFR